MTAMKIQDRSPAHKAQLEHIRLPRTLMGGTRAMREARETYLPRKARESAEAYKARLHGGALDNYFARTVDYLAGQVFQKEADYLDVGEKRAYDAELFAQFKEDVDQAGSGFSVFSQNLFKNGIIDGISFVLVDYSRVNTRVGENGVLEYEMAAGTWAPKTAEADAVNGWRPYFVGIRAEQVLDAWLDGESGRQVLRHFRYQEIGEAANDERGLDRDVVVRTRAWWPDHWEVWEARDKKKPALVDAGPNALGYVPVFWFRPGLECAGLTAESPLADLAEMNRVHWGAYSNHVSLMTWERLFLWVGQNLTDDEGKTLAFGPGFILNAAVNAGGAPCDLKAVGPPTETARISLDDLENIEARMRAYGLQVAFAPQGSAGVTATEAGISAAASDSQLKGWCGLLKDCLENALKAVADYTGGLDGPAVFVNTEFRATLDVSILAMLSSLVDREQFPVEGLWAVMKTMGVLADDMAVDEIKKLLDQARQNQPPPTL